MNVSMYIGKPVLTPAGGACGYVTEARLTRDYTAISSLVCADGEEEEFFLPARAVLSVGDAVIAGPARLGAPSGLASPVGRTVFSHVGEALGVISDLILPEGLIVVNGTAYPAALCLFGEHTVLYPDEITLSAAKKAGTPRRPPAKHAKKEVPMSEIASQKHSERIAPTAEPVSMSEDEPLQTAETTEEASMSEPKPAAEPVPMSETAPMSEDEPAKTAETEPKPQTAEVRLLNGNNLLGRRVKRTVYGRDGLPLIPAGERVTPSVIAAARRENKLLALTVNTLTSL